MNIAHLRVFHQLVMSGSVTKAASSLQMPKYSVSRILTQLEAELGVKLFVRNTRNFRLNERGERFFQLIETPFMQMDQVLQDFATMDVEKLTGPIRISVPEDFGVDVMSRIVFEFQHIHPEVQIELQAENRVVDLVAENFDIALRAGNLRDSTLMRRQIAEIGMCFVCSPAFYDKIKIENAIRKMDILDPQKFPFQGVPFYSFRKNQNREFEFSTKKNDKTVKVRVKPSLVSGNFFVIRDWLLQGDGIGLIPSILARKSVREGKLVELFSDWTTESVSLQLLWPKQHEKNRKVKALVQFIEKNLGRFI